MRWMTQISAEYEADTTRSPRPLRSHSFISSTCAGVTVARINEKQCSRQLQNEVPSVLQCWGVQGDDKWGGGKRGGEHGDTSLSCHTALPQGACPKGTSQCNEYTCVNSDAVLMVLRWGLLKESGISWGGGVQLVVVDHTALQGGRVRIVLSRHCTQNSTEGSVVVAAELKRNFWWRGSSRWWGIPLEAGWPRGPWSTLHRWCWRGRRKWSSLPVSRWLWHVMRVLRREVGAWFYACFGVHQWIQDPGEGGGNLRPGQRLKFKGFQRQTSWIHKRYLTLATIK